MTAGPSTESTDDDRTRTFQPTKLTRCVNVLATLVLAASAAAETEAKAPEVLRGPAFAGVAVVACAIVWRSGTLAVTVGGRRVTCRGVLRTVKIEKDALVGYNDTTANSWPSWLADVPAVSWQDEGGRTRRCRLWMFAEGPDARFGVDGMRTVRAELGRTMQAAVLVAHRQRKRRR